MLENYVCFNKDDCPFDYKTCSWGFKGENADNTKLLVIAHRPDDRIDISRKSEPMLFDQSQNDHETQFRISHTGRFISQMLAYSNLSLKDICFTNVFWGCPPRDVNVKAEQYKFCLPNLYSLIFKFDPEAMILYGRKAYESLFPIEAKDSPIVERAGSELIFDPGIIDPVTIKIPTIIFPHPTKMKFAIKKEVSQTFQKLLKQFLQRHNII